MNTVSRLPFRKVWWFNPSYIIAVFLIPIYLLLWFAGSHSDGEISTAKGFYFFYGEIAFLGFLGLFFMYIGTLSPIKYIPDDSKSLQRHTFVLNMSVLTVIGWISLIGYFYWFKDIIMSPSLLLAQFQQNSFFSLRGVIEHEGIASFAQVGLVYVIFFFYQFLFDKNKLNRTQYVLFYSIIILVTLRVFLWSERVALIELMVALLLIWVSYTKSKNVYLEKLLPFFPLLGVVFIVLFFGLGEFFRSWSSFYINQSAGFWEFILQRLVNYYFEALNTGAGMLTTQSWPTYDFAFVLTWMHRLPFFGDLISFSVGLTPESASSASFLVKYGDPEFNNPSGLFTIFSDIGIGLGLLFFFLLGVVSRYCYAMLEDRVSFYGCVYFIFLMFFLELFRYFYIGSPRVFMVLLGFLILFLTQKKVVKNVSSGR